MPSRTVRALTAMAAVCAFASAPRLQESKAEPSLEALLDELVRVPAAAWEERMQSARDAAASERAKVGELRAQIAELEQRIAECERREKSAVARVNRLETLREAVAALGRGAAPAAAPVEAAAKPEVDAPDEGERLFTFDDHLQPIFEESCTICHDSVDQEGGLDLTSYRGLVQGGGSGKTLVPGDPQASRLFLLVSHQSKPTMPPDEPRIPDDQVEAIRTWITQGAPQNAARAKELAAERAAARAAKQKETSDAGAEALPAVLPESLPPVERRQPAAPPAMRTLARSPCAPLLAMPGQEQVLLWHAERLEELGVLEFPYGQIEVLRFSADGARLLAAGGRPGREGGAVVYDVRTGAELGRYGESSDSVLAAAIDPAGERIALGGPHRRLDVFRIDGGARLYRVEHDEWVLACDFDPAGELLASADRGGLVLVTQARTGRNVHELGGHTGAVQAVCFAPDGATLASAGADGTIRGWRSSDGRALWNERGHSAGALCLTWSGPERLVSGGADGRVRAWNASGKKDGDLPQVGEWVYGAAAAASATRLHAVDWRGRLHEIDLESREIRRTAVPLAIVQ